MSAPFQFQIIAPIINPAGIGDTNSQCIGSGAEWTGYIAVIRSLGNHVVPGQLSVDKNLYPLTKPANMKSYLLPVPRSGDLEPPPEPRHAAISAVAHLGVVISVFVLPGCVRTRAEPSPIILLHGRGQSDCRALLLIQHRPSARGRSNREAGNIYLIGKKQRVVRPSRLRIRPQAPAVIGNRNS